MFSKNFIALFTLLSVASFVQASSRPLGWSRNLGRAKLVKKMNIGFGLYTVNGESTVAKTDDTTSEELAVKDQDLTQEEYGKFAFHRLCPENKIRYIALYNALDNPALTADAFYHLTEQHTSLITTLFSLWQTPLNNQEVPHKPYRNFLE